MPQRHQKQTQYFLAHHHTNTNLMNQPSITASQRRKMSRRFGNMDFAFINGQKIIHPLRSTYDGVPILKDAWTGIYKDNTIEHQSVTYDSITAFAAAHEKTAGIWRDPMRCLDACYIKLDGTWVPVYNLPSPVKIDGPSHTNTNSPPLHD